MSWTDGDVINTEARLRRLSSAIPSSYTIFKIGSDYYAETNVAGGTNYGPDANATTVIQAAIDVLTSGGVIFLKSGTYPIDTKLSLAYPNIIIKGEGKGVTNIQPTSGFSDWVFEITGIAGYYSIRDLLVDCTNAQTTATGALNLVGSQHGDYSNLYLYRADVGTLLKLNTASHWNNFYNCRVVRALIGVHIAGASNANTFWGGYIGCASIANSKAVYIQNGSDNRWYRTDITTSVNGFDIDAGDRNILGNRFEVNDTEFDSYINIASGVRNTQVLCYVPFIEDAGSHTIVICPPTPLNINYGHFFDDFFGTAVDGRWNQSTGGTGVIAMVATTHGVVQISSGATSGGTATLNFNGNFNFVPTANTYMQAKIVGSMQDTTQMTVQVGFKRGATDYAYFEYDAGAGGVNWYCENDNGSGPTSTDTGVAGDTSSHTFEVIYTGTGKIRFLLDGVLESTSTTNISTLSTEPHLYIINKENVNKRFRVDYVQYGSPH